ncbi:hypothetical protein QUA43_21850, partial [Microcoleus sp. N9_B4]|uniref:hypothetical protein n=1 Tax=Microcoleus sp. N9_B4 TaxID=3055386 RepID=UPI002FD3B066
TDFLTDVTDVTDGSSATDFLTDVTDVTDGSSATDFLTDVTDGRNRLQGESAIKNFITVLAVDIS